MFLHELPDIKQLFQVVSDELSIAPSIVEKDYWVMHALWGLTRQNYQFELKGGTSLSKGFGLIYRFSEDIDIQLHPSPDLELKIGKNHNKATHIRSRAEFFDSISEQLNIPGLNFNRDHQFDDKKMRGAGIRGLYDSHFQTIPSLKEGILFELGFDKTTPYVEKNISSWAFDKATNSGVDIIDNRAECIKCYKPEYSLIEKLQTISTKYRINKGQSDKSPVNFIRHYYDVYCLLNIPSIRTFIGTKEYLRYKQEKFGSLDETDLTKNPAFNLSEDELKSFDRWYREKSDIYFKAPPSFKEIMKSLSDRLEVL